MGLIRLAPRILRGFMMLLLCGQEDILPGLELYMDV